MEKFKNLLIVAGTGRKSGKTTLACSIIKRFKQLCPIAIKISPHFHVPSDGLQLLKETDNCRIFEEKSVKADKDSSKMLVSGAVSAYYIQVYDNNAGEAFLWLANYLGTENPIVCESPALRHYIDPGLFLIADNKDIVKKKNLGRLIDIPDMVVMFGESESIPGNLKLVDGGWKIFSS